MVPVAVGHPWADLTEPQRIDFLPPLVTAMLRPTICDPPVRATRSEAVEAAVVHGRERRAHGFTEQAVLLEYFDPPRTVDRQSDRAPVPMPPVAGARADVLLSVLALATVHAYRNEAGGGAGRWRDAIQVLLGD